jgi:hypothetical protein
LKTAATLSLGLVLLICGIGSLRAQQTETPSIGVWYIYFADYEFSEKWSVHHETHLHLFEPFNTFNRFVIRGGINYEFKPNLTGSAFYHYSYSDPTYSDIDVANTLIENRLMEQLIYRQKWHGWGLSHRLRTEQRFQNREGTDFTAFRARYSLLVNHKLIGRFYANGTGEILSEYQKNATMSYRLSGALGARLNSHLRLQAGYTHFFLTGGKHDQRLTLLLLFRTDAKKTVETSTS